MKPEYPEGDLNRPQLARGLIVNILRDFQEQLERHPDREPDLDRFARRIMSITSERGGHDC